MNTIEFAYDVYQILIEECGADPSIWVINNFPELWPKCKEYRFIGNQGFGGKIWSPGTMDRNHAMVTCYSEDDNPERKAARDRANERLTAL